MGRGAVVGLAAGLLALVVAGFCTWEGGLFGLSKPNVHFRRFEKDLKAGKHIFFVEVSPEQKTMALGVIEQHPKLLAVGSEQSMPEWRTFVDVMP